MNKFIFLGETLIIIFSNKGEFSMSNKGDKVISTKYGKGTNYNDEIEGYELVDNEEGYDYFSNNEVRREVLMRIFPSPDW